VNRRRARAARSFPASHRARAPRARAARRQVGRAGRRQLPRPIPIARRVGFFRGYLNPIVEKCAGSRFAVEPRYEVPGEIDRVELDMREGMEQRDTPRRRAERPPLRHLLGWAQQWSRRPRRPSWGRGTSDLEGPHPPPFGQPATGRDFRRGLGGLEDRDRPDDKCAEFCQSARAALRTSATWPGTRTFRHAPRTMPFRSMRKVERSIPI